MAVLEYFADPVPWGIGALALCWVAACLWRGKRTPGWLVLIPFLAMILIIPLGGYWIERAAIASYASLQQDQLKWAWPKGKENAWGAFPGSVALASLPAAVLLFFGVRESSDGWHPARTAWALIVNAVGLVLTLLALRVSVSDGPFVAILLLQLAATCRAARLLAGTGHPDGTRAVLAVVFSLQAVLFCSAMSGANLITPYDGGPGPLAGAAAWAEWNHQRDLAQDRAWLECLAAAAFLAFPLLTSGIRRARLLLLLPFLTLPFLLVRPERVRTREMPCAPPPPPDTPDVEIPVETP